MAQKKVTDFIGSKVKYDECSYIWGEGPKGGMQMIMDIRVRGWGAIQHLFDSMEEAENFQDEVAEWIADAINQKLEKERR